MSTDAATPRTRDERQQELGRALVNNLFVLLRTAYMHEQNNQALLPPLANIQATASGLHALGADPVQLRAAGRSWFLSQELVKLDPASFQNAEFLRVICEELGIGDIEIARGAAEQDFRALMVAVIEAVRSGPGASDRLQRKCGRIQLKPRTGTAENAEELDRRQFVLRTYATALVFMGDLFANWKGGRRPGLAKVKRIVQGLLDVVRENGVTLLGLTQLRAYRHQPANHMVNVAVLSMMMGVRAELPRQTLVQLGMSALLHELGLMDLPEALVQRIDTLGEVEKKELDRLPYYTTRRVLEFGSLTADAAARLVVAFENRAHVPTATAWSGNRERDPFAEIVAVADAYDHLTTSRLGNPALQPDQALEQLLSGRDNRFAAWAAKLLADGIGRYPIGTMVELSTGEKGIVMDRPRPGAPASRPPVRLLGGAGAAIVDLSTKRGGHYERSIVRTLDAEQQNVNAAHFFLD